MSSVSLRSFNDLRTILLRRGIPARYVHRVTAELADHAEDIASNSGASMQNLGDLSRLADEITQAYRCRTFAGRHPWLTFGVFPLPMVVLATCGVLMGYFGLLTLFWKLLNLPTDGQFGSFGTLLRVTATVLPSISTGIVTWFLCRAARRAGYHWSRAVAACLPVLLFSVYTFSCYRPDPSGVSDGLYVIGAYIPYVSGNSLIGALGRQQLLQVLVPVLVIGWMMIHEVRKHSPLKLPQTV